MLKRELYLNRIDIDETYSMQVNADTETDLIIYENSTEIDRFPLSKRIVSLFKLIEEYTGADNCVEDMVKKTRLYGRPIHIKDEVYMQLNPDHNELVVDFYRIDNGNKDLLYLTKTNYMTQKLFNMMLIPEKVIKNANFQVMNPKLFKDFVDIMSVIKI